MPGFVRAMAVTERSVLAGAPTPDRRAVAVIDEARRAGLQVILVSSRTFAELVRGNEALLAHFDGVVAESGGAVRVGGGPAVRLPDGPGTGLLAVLEALDVDPHDALGLAADADDVSGLGVLEVAVTATETARVGRSHGKARTQRRRTPRRTPRRTARRTDVESAASVVEPTAPVVDAPSVPADYRILASGAEALRKVLDGARAARSFSPSRHDVRLVVSGADGDVELSVPGAHANVLVCTADADRSAVPAQLVTLWAAAGYSSVVFDSEDRHAAAFRLDAAREGWLEELARALHGRPGAVVVRTGGLVGLGRSQALVTGLAVVRAARRRNGRPHWLVLDRAWPVLTDPDLPPEALDLRDRGHCLVLRRHVPISPALLDMLDTVIPCGPGCPLPARTVAVTPTELDLT
jgi:hypothetical protein